MALEKYLKGTKAQKLKSEYGTPSEFILANMPNTSVNTSMENRGCSTAHPIPITL
jgi:hypothetical protein